MGSEVNRIGVTLSGASVRDSTAGSVAGTPLGMIIGKEGILPAPRSLSRAPLNDGSNSAGRMPMIAITTSNSINVNTL